MKTVDDIVAPLNMFSNAEKRIGVLGNFATIIAASCTIHKSRKWGVIEMSQASYEMRRDALKHLSANSNEYMDLKGRDLCDVVRSVANLKMSTASNADAQSFCDKQLRILAKRCALSFGRMPRRSREKVAEYYSRVDFYDNDLVSALKKYKLVKGSDKK